MFVLPIQDATQKFLAAKIVSRLFLCLTEIFFDRGLRPDAGMIHPRQPKNFVTLHSRASGENVLDRIVQNMAEREDTGDVRRRHDDGERRLRRMRIRAEIALLQPARVPLRLDAGRVVIFRKFRHRVASCESATRLQVCAGLADDLRRALAAVTFARKCARS